MSCKGQLLPINLPAVGEKLFRALNLRGGLTASQLTDVVQAGVTTLDLTDPEYLWLARTKRYAGVGAGPQVAAQNAQVEFRNNAGSGLLMRVNTLQLQTNANTGVGIFLSTVVNLGLVESVRRQALDSRQEEAGGLSTPTPQGFIFAGASAFPIPANAYFFTATAGVVYEFPWLPIILKPGTYLRLVAGTTNTSMDVRLSWQERIPTPSEL